MLRFLSSVFCVFVLLLVIACPSARRRNSSGVSIDSPKGSVLNSDVNKSQGEQSTPGASSNNPTVNKGKVKIGKFPENMMDGNNFQVTDDVLEYLKVNLKDNLSKISPLYTPTEKTVGTENTDAISYKVTKIDNDNDSFHHKYSEKIPVIGSEEESEILITLKNVKNNDNTVKVFGEMMIDKKDGTPNQNGIVSVIFGTQTNKPLQGGCTNGTTQGSDSSCYSDPVVFDSNEVAQSGKVYISFSVAHGADDGVNRHGKYEYDMSKANDKAKLKKLGFLN